MRGRFDRNGISRHGSTLRLGVVLTLIFVAGTPGLTQDPEDERRDESDPALTHWRYFAGLDLPKNVDPKTRYGVIELTEPIIGRANADLSDLRLTSAEGVRIPYVLRVARTSSIQTPIPIERRFNAGPTAADRAFEESFEIQAPPLPGHNEIEIDTPGDDFRRLVQVFGANSADFEKAQTLLPPKTHLVRFTADGRTVLVNRFRYGNQTFRFLKIRVDADQYNGEGAPKIERVVVYQSRQTEGKYLTYPVTIGDTQGVQTPSGPGTAYQLTLGSDPTFCEKLSLRAEFERPPDRPFRLQIGGPGQIREDVAGVEWRWRTNGDERFVDLTFPEVRANRVRLIVTDFANPPLRFSNAAGVMAARQVYFEWPDVAKTPLPLKLFFGNDAARPPRYDLEKQLPTTFDPPAAIVGIGARQDNVNYVTPARAFSERHPWAIYVVLATACAVMAGLLVPLAREAIAQSREVPAQ
jgi:hypothetical protein